MEQNLQEMDQALQKANNFLKKNHDQLEIINYTLYLAEKNRFNSFDKNICLSILMYWRTHGKISDKQLEVLAKRTQKYKKNNPLPAENQMKPFEPVCLIED